jgi:hypothetical protein
MTKNGYNSVPDSFIAELLDDKGIFEKRCFAMVQMVHGLSLNLDINITFFHPIPKLN